MRLFFSLCISLYFQNNIHFQKPQECDIVKSFFSKLLLNKSNKMLEFYASNSPETRNFRERLPSNFDPHLWPKPSITHQIIGQNQIRGYKVNPTATTSQKIFETNLDFGYYRVAHRKLLIKPPLVKFAKLFFVFSKIIWLSSVHEFILTASTAYFLSLFSKTYAIFGCVH